MNRSRQDALQCTAVRVERRKGHHRHGGRLGRQLLIEEGRQPAIRFQAATTCQDGRWPMVLQIGAVLYLGSPRPVGALYPTPLMADQRAFHRAVPWTKTSVPDINTQ